MEYTFIIIIINAILQLLELMLQVVTLYYGGCLVFKNQMSGGELVALLLYQVSLTAAIDVSLSIRVIKRYHKLKVMN